MKCTIWRLCVVMILCSSSVFAADADSLNKNEAASPVNNQDGDGPPNETAGDFRYRLTSLNPQGFCNWISIEYRMDGWDPNSTYSDYDVEFYRTTNENAYNTMGWWENASSSSYEIIKKCKGSVYGSFNDSTNLKPNTTYYYSARVTDGVSYSNFYYTMSAWLMQLNLPTNIKVVKDECFYNKITWDYKKSDDYYCAQNVNMFRIYRDDFFIAEVAENPRIYVDKNAIPGVNHGYKVSVVRISRMDYGADVESECSSAVYIKHDISKATNLQAKGQGCSGIEISWDWNDDTPLNFGINYNEWGEPKSLYFSGSSYNYVKMKDIILANRGMTIESWVKASSFYTNTNPEETLCLIELGDGNSDDYIRLGLTPVNTSCACLVVQSCYYSSSYNSKIFVKNNSVTAGVWNHVAVSYSTPVDHKSGVKIYLNGKLVAEANDVYFPEDMRFAGSYLGKWSSTNYYHKNFNGYIDDFRVWEKTLTASDIQSNMNRVLPDNQSGLVVNYRFYGDDKNPPKTFPGSDKLSINYAALNSDIAPVVNIMNVPGTQNSFTVDDIKPNLNYYFSVAAKYKCNYWANLSATVTGKSDFNVKTPENFFASKGYHADKVELKWDADNSINRYQIYRGTAQDQSPVQLVTLNGGVFNYDDKTAVPGIIYNYSLKAEKICGEKSVGSDLATETGFTEAAGIVTGHVEFEGGNAVEDVEVFVEPTLGGALKFLGYVILGAIDFHKTYNFGGVTFEFWEKFPPFVYSRQLLVFGNDMSDRIYVTCCKDMSLNVYCENNLRGNTLTFKNALRTDEWQHIAITIDRYKKCTLYIDGELFASQYFENLPRAILRQNCSIGNVDNGIMDELRIWNVARSADEIKRDCHRILNGNEDGLVAYYRFDENTGDMVYDRSKTQEIGKVTYHEHHGKILNATWTNDTPNADQLHISGFTNEKGNYEINGIRYIDKGQTFTITPTLGVHKFQPGSRSAFIGKDSPVINQVDFLDISSFEVTGRVKYDSTNCPAKDIFVLIDGEQTNPPTKTDDKGEFAINVPIGRHQITVYAPNHEFVTDSWPANNPHNFIQPVDVGVFLDKTKPIVIGRVVGGWREAEADWGKHKNNLGQADIKLESQNGCISKTVTTDNNTGAFKIDDLPPMKYNVTTKMKNTLGETIYRFEPQVLDMSINAPLTTVVDTTKMIDNSAAVSCLNDADYIETDLPMDYRYAYTIDMWFKYPFTVNSSGYNFLTNGRFNNWRYCHIAVKDGKYLGMYKEHVTRYYECKNNGEAYDISSLSAGWHHITMSYSNKKMDYYIDGAYVGTIGQYCGALPQMFGNSSDKMNSWGGEFDEIRLWDSSLSQDQIKSIMNVRMKGDEPGLLMYYRFEEGTGSSVADLTGNTKATLNGASWVTDSQSLPQAAGAAAYSYHYKLDLIHFADPRLTIEGIPEKPCAGLMYPVFQQHKPYGLRIKLEEEYINYDKAEGDTSRVNHVPVKEGMITINNSIADKSQEKIQLTNDINPQTGYRYPLGDTLYTFKTGFPNFLTDAVNPDLSYTKTLEIVAVVKGGKSASNTIRAYVVGAKARENNFITRGPERVQLILRDPPGSESFAYQSDGSSYSFSESMSISKELSAGLETEISLGADFIYGIGVMTELDVTVDFNSSISTTINNTNYHELNRTMKFSKTFSTSENSDIVGGDADVYMGGSENFLYGMTDVLKINPETCKMEMNTGLFLVPDGFATTFIYTGDHILNYLIPNLKMLRNNLFNKEEYTSNIPEDDSRYGTNNDDSIWGAQRTSTTAVQTEPADLIGPSYTFVEPANYSGLADSIRWYNQQIRLWREAIMLNDSLKASAQFKQNISFDANANYDQEEEITIANTVESSYEIGVSAEFAASVGVEMGGIGASVTVGVGVNSTTGKATSTTDEKTVTTGFSLRDSDEGDYYSIDILHDEVYGTPVFKTVAGQSMCPWEQNEYWIKDYNYPAGMAPNNVILSNATQHRELPTLFVHPTVIQNVPPDEPAVYTLKLGNASESDDDMYYRLRILQETNPWGAVVAVNGVIIEDYLEYMIPAGESMTATLTLHRGPVKYDYENIKLMIYSACEYESEILISADTVAVTANFVRDCTPLAIFTPVENWVVNTDNRSVSGKDTTIIKVIEYDVQDPYLENIKIQYRPLDGNLWYTLETYNKAEWTLVDATTNTFETNTAPPFIPGNFPANVTGIPDDYSMPPNYPVIVYNWDVTELPDKKYQLRAIANCSLAEENTPLVTGLLDRVRPHAFGTPQPTDGILSIGEDILLRLNENIQSSPGVLTFNNFDVRGILNGTKIDHSTSLYFDGTDDYVTVPNNYSLDVSNLTIECWVNLQKTTGWQTLAMKGNYGYGLAVDENLKLHFWNQSAKANTSVSEKAIPENEWTHVAFATDGTSGSYFINGKPINVTASAQIINNSGDLYFGRSGEAGVVDVVNGFVHEVRIWGTKRTQGEIASKMSVSLTGREAGLIGCWRMDEGSGDLLEDIANDYHAAIAEATWKIYPLGKSIELAGNQTVNANLYETSLENYTVEFWVRPTTSAHVPILRINAAEENQRILFHQNSANIECDFNHSLGDDRGNLTAPVDANAWQHIALTWNGFQGRLYKNGALAFETADSLVFDYFHTIQIGDSAFTGSFDDVRIWKLARTQSQIERYHNHRLSGQEPGLIAYYPFEKHNPQLVAETTLNDLSATWEYETTENNGCGCWKYIDNENHATGPVDLKFADDTPPIKIERPVQRVNFSWTVSENEIFINLLTPDSLIEQCQLDVTISNLKDMNGNVMASPVTWDVFINRNPLSWKQQSITEVKNIHDAHLFNAEVENKSAITQTFEVVQLPDWLTATPQTVNIDPQSEATVTFSVHPGLNAGIYNTIAYLKSSFGYEQRLPISVRVLTPPPSWSVNSTKYEYGMNIVADVQIKGQTTTDTFDMIGAFVGAECRGVANISYVSDTDQYLAFLNVYSNSASGETITFNVWSSQYGVEYVEVTPTYTFTADALHGTLKSPITLNASGNVAQQIECTAGWTWLSFNKAADDLAVNAMLASLSPVNNDQIKSQTTFAQYGAGTWAGSLTNIEHKKMYMIKLASSDVLEYGGDIIQASTKKISVTSGWNWIGYIPNSNIEINEALAYFNASQNDVIKGQNSFALYDIDAGWQGSLKYLVPGQGYKLYAGNNGELVYPDRGMYLPTPGLAKQIALSENISDWKVAPEPYQYNMTITATVDQDNTDQCILAAFVGDQCRGVAYPVLSEKLKKNVYFLMAHSEAFENELIELRLFDNATGEERVAIKKTTFVSDGMLGTLGKPVEIKTRELRAGDLGYVPKEFMLSQNYPNPFNPVTRIGFGVPTTSHVTIKVYNIRGQEVATLFDEQMDAGYRYVEWNSASDSGIQMASGMYFIKMVSGNFVKTRKMMLLK
ncbi:T9SS type A sorting domain-containing protein [candidate division KSB1 bacterium]|nr:T9SS type A sorting domain-containing protein [candidate division KSB1 bacterium]